MSKLGLTTFENITSTCYQVTNLTGSRQCRKEIITMFLAFFFIDANGSPALGVVYNRVGSSVDMTIWMAHAEA